MSTIDPKHQAPQSEEDSIITADEFEHRIAWNAKIEEGRVRKPTFPKFYTRMKHLVNSLSNQIEELIEMREITIKTMYEEKGTLDPYIVGSVEFLDMLANAKDDMEFFYNREARRIRIYNESTTYQEYEEKVKKLEDYEPYRTMTDEQDN